MERTRTATPRMMSEIRYSIGMATGIVRGGAALGDAGVLAVVWGRGLRS